MNMSRWRGEVERKGSERGLEDEPVMILSCWSQGQKTEAQSLVSLTDKRYGRERNSTCISVETSCAGVGGRVVEMSWVEVDGGSRREGKELHRGLYDHLGGWT